MSRIGQYELLDRIAVGGMAEVFRGRGFGEEGFEKLVAIKRILPSLARDSRFTTMLQTEARIHASLSHRNIVQIHDLGVSQDGEYFIVLEYVDGPDLGALLTRLGERRTATRLPDAVALYIAIELGEGVHFAHDLCGPDGQPIGLVHRDISPSNVLLSYAGEVKLSDFGLAKRSTDHSVVGSLKGKLTYMSPEQARRAPLDRQSDIFALGAVLFELLTGHPLRQITDEVTGWQQVAAGLVPPARKFRADITPALERLLQMALAPDPRERFLDGRAFVTEARAALEVLPRSRVGEAGELQAILKSVLPPGAPRPARAPSKVIRLRSKFGPMAGAPTPPPRAEDPAALQITPPPQPPMPPISTPPSPPLRSAPGPSAPRRPTPAVLLPPPRPEERRSAAGLIAVNEADQADRTAKGAEEEARIIAAWPSLGFTGTPAASLTSGPIGSTRNLTPAAPVPIAMAGRPPSSTDKVFPPAPSSAGPPVRFRTGPVMAPVTPPAQTGRFAPVSRPGPGGPGDFGPGQHPPASFSYAPPPPPGRRPGRASGSSVVGAIFIILVLGSALVGAGLHFLFAPLPVLQVWFRPARLHIASDPPGAEVFVDGQRLPSLTPAQIEVRRDRRTHSVELRRRGFEPQQRQIRYDRQVPLAVTANLIATAPPPPPAPSRPPPARGAPATVAPTVPTAGAAGKRPVEKKARPKRPRRRGKR
jgi:eukaryotic-like serine/threonine-protein kinase